MLETSNEHLLVLRRKLVVMGIIENTNVKRTLVQEINYLTLNHGSSFIHKYISYTGIYPWELVA